MMTEGWIRKVSLLHFGRKIASNTAIIMVLIMIALNLNYAVFGVAPNDIGESIILYLSFLFAALSLLRFAFVYPRLKPRPRIVISAIYIIFIACAVLTNLFFDFSRSSFFLDNLDFFVFFGGVIYFVSLDEFYLEKC